jgi:hypothetical protein
MNPFNSRIIILAHHSTMARERKCGYCSSLVCYSSLQEGMCDDCVKRLTCTIRFKEAIDVANYDTIRELAPIVGHFHLGKAVKFACQTTDIPLMEIVAPPYKQHGGLVTCDTGYNTVVWTKSETLFQDICRNGTPEMVDWFLENDDTPSPIVLDRIICDSFERMECSIEMIDRLLEIYDRDLDLAQQLRALKNAAQNSDIPKLEYIENRYGLPDFPDLESHIIHVRTDEQTRMSEGVPPGTTCSWLLERYDISLEKVETLLAHYDSSHYWVVRTLRRKKRAVKWLCGLVDIDPTRVDDLITKYGRVYVDED